ncbi:zinc ribbon domain-containing protein [Opitutaceae bacterium TAV4]|uniref:FmdB family zinc ribbon protein n=1 Tax=Geminisphaera colitermitum TaxID=1148786 RepID=UPI00019651B8|nr:zinc ribbon domain-containing protein [Geminisphaera colitermitum]RRJ98971.1 zinc ribbon domain-containing protein [Opitutaceae bacterium TAV3]RRK01398.1 zinc ribbon domain-containing protein [Opitutaceae bacterium TAV4]
MPVYRYVPKQSPCKLCGTGFDYRHSAGGEALTHCPTCGQPVTREAVHTVNTPKLLKPLSVTDAKQAGFTVLKRTAAGEYEKQ